MPSPLADPVKLPCGLVFPNRLSKVGTAHPKAMGSTCTNLPSQAAMAEMMAKSNQPNDNLVDAYDKWSQGGWCSILTGNHSIPTPTIFHLSHQPPNNIIRQCPSRRQPHGLPLRPSPAHRVHRQRRRPPRTVEEIRLRRSETRDPDHRADLPPRPAVIPRRW